MLSKYNIGAGNFIYEILNNNLVDGYEKKLRILSEIEDINLSINDIANKSNDLASAYYNIGVKERDVVALYFSNTFDYFLHFVALNSIGAIPALINGQMPLNILSEYINKIKPDFLILNSTDFLDLKYRVKTYSISELTSHTNNIRPKLFNHQNDDVIMIGHTSGTTGIPKGVIFTHESMFHGVKSQIHSQKGKNILSILPHSHGASISLLMLSLTRGAHVTIISQVNTQKLENFVKDISPDVVIAFPKVYLDLYRMNLNPDNFSSINYWIATGDALHEKHIKKFIGLGHHIIDNKKHEGSYFVDNLGSSEFAFAIFRNIHSPYTNNYHRCIGKPFKWVNVAVFDENNNIIHDNKVGRLGVKSKSVTKGYWNDCNLTEKNKIDEFWLTGDLVYSDDKGNYFHVDRVSDSIGIGDNIYYSCEIEEFLISNIDEILDVTVVESKGALIAYVELQEYITKSEYEILEKINAHLIERFKCNITTLNIESANNNLGITGKKLKRNLKECVNG